MSKRKLLLSILVLLLASTLVSQVRAVSFWVDGAVTDAPTEVTFGVTFYMFSFNVTSSSDGLGNITCVGLKTLGPFATAPQLGDHYNLTGEYVATQPTNDSVPVGFFLISSVNSNAPPLNQTSDWVSALQGSFDFAASVGKWLVTFFIQIVGLGGVALTDYVVAFVLAGAAGVAVFLRIRWYLTVTALFVCSTVTVYIIQTYLQLLLGVNF